jgi:hypothetical protein
VFLDYKACCCSVVTTYGTRKAIFMLKALRFTLVLSKVGVQCPRWLFSLVNWFHTFQVCCSGIFSMNFDMVQLPVLILALLLFLHSSCALLLLGCFCIITFSRLSSWSPLHFLRLQYILTVKVILHYYGLWWKLIVRDGSVGLCLLIPQYDYRAFMTSMYRFWYILIPVCLI